MTDVQVGNVIITVDKTSNLKMISIFANAFFSQKNENEVET